MVRYKANFLRTSLVLLAIGMVALLGIVGTSLWLVERTKSNFADVVRERQMRSAAADLLALVKDAETSQRGYLLTLSPQYLDPYNAAVKNFPPALEKMRSLLQAVNPDDPSAAILSDVLPKKIAELKETIDLANSGRVAEALEIVRTDAGQQYMDQARRALAEVIESADSRLREGVENQYRSNNALTWVSVIGLMAILIVLGGSYRVVSRYVRALAEARDRVEVLNTGLEERVNERTQDLMRANEEVQRFAYIVTHDLRAPLVNIMGFTAELDTTMRSIQDYILTEDDGMPKEQLKKEALLAVKEDLPEAIGFIRKSTKKMDGLINAILKISRDGRRPLNAEHIDLQELLSVASGSVQHQVADADGEIVLDVKGLRVHTDRLSLEQIFGNLLDNAVKYRVRDRALRIVIRARKQGRNHLMIEVEDNGRGVAESDHSRIFDLFRRSGAQDSPGEGIGLAHVRSLVRNLGGDITVKSVLGEGTTFMITLPINLRAIVRSDQ
ncbi:CHASE3 domain-containing protein [Rhizobium sp. CFBP 8762]|uniref:sensor histidine kinase n=1 Tax=Rhizobium sp. CFBP 8762 TaxID=2775279 RepID=UPI00177B0136|nr:CHASE3 domain-containing protein [Rhizobium sp. CFBP 8762]MBD8553141.1 CHASE3 domain-containing protein [Rhizobium sp. CFBP 8762]